MDRLRFKINSTADYRGLVGKDNFTSGASVYHGWFIQTDVTTGNVTATAAMTNTTFYLGTAGRTITLPTPANGLVYRFVVSANVATTNMVVQGPAADATDDVIYGAVTVAGALLACSALKPVQRSLCE